MRTALTALCLFLAPGVGAMQNNIGTAAADFLRLGAGARALGMGEAFTAVTDGPESAYWNPAGLPRMTRPEVVYARSELPAGVHHDFIAAGAPVRLLHGTLALAVTRLSQESLDLVNAANQTVGSFSPHSEVYALAYGYRFSEADPTEGARDYFRETWNVPNVDRPLSHEREPWTGEVSAGLAMKIVSEDLGTRRASAFAIDGGGMFRPADFPEFILGGAVRNLGGKMRFISASESLPAEAACSLAYEVQTDSWRLLPALEVDLPYAGNPYGRLGFEALRRLSEGVRAAARLGYSSRTAPDLGVLSGVTAGAGLGIGRFQFDAAFQPMGLLGESFRLGVGWRF